MSELQQNVQVHVQQFECLNNKATINAGYTFNCRLIVEVIPFSRRPIITSKPTTYEEDKIMREIKLKPK